MSIIKDAFIRFNLELSDLRGQCYDGAANMAGCVSGVQARLQAEYPKPMFVRCIAHSLNLAIRDSVQAISLTRDAIDYTKEMSGFMTCSAKREDVFSQAQLELTASNKADHSAASGKLFLAGLFWKISRS